MRVDACTQMVMGRKSVADRMEIIRGSAPGSQGLRFTPKVMGVFVDEEFIGRRGQHDNEGHRHRLERCLERHCETSLFEFLIT